jgi:hypothetical protein
MKKRMWKTVRGRNTPDENKKLEKSVKNMIRTAKTKLTKFKKKLVAG